jgi:plastocyanin
LVIIVAMAVLTTVGCVGGSSGPRPSATRSTVIASPSASATSSAIARPTILEGGTGYTFVPARLTVRSGTPLTISNVSQIPITHTFTIAEHGIDVVLNPGESRTITIELPPGSYRFVCRFHVALGMKGRLVVTG